MLIQFIVLNYVMKIRTTERYHEFTSNLFKELRIFSLEGLTLSKNKEWTAAIEAIQYDDNIEIDINNIDVEKFFSINSLKAKYFLSQTLSVPLYFVIHHKKTFFILKIIKSDKEKNFSYNVEMVLEKENFALWWSEIKGLQQPKKLYEASSRVYRSIFDNTLKEYGLAWGGNIDGFMFKNKKYACVIENIYTQKNPLESEKGEPSYYFHMRGPNYNSWYPTAKLANDLGVPLILFTIEGNSYKERIGFSVISRLSKDGIFYKDNKKPNMNIINGIENIKNILNESLLEKSPIIE